MTNQGNVTPKDHNNHPITEHKDMEIYELPNKGFKIAVLRNLNELQNPQKDNSVKSEKKIIHNQNEKLTKD